MSRNTKYLVSLSIALSLLLVLTGVLFTTNQGLANQIADVAEFSATIGNDAGVGSGHLPLKVVGPEKAKVGDTITFTVMGDGATDLGGFEFALQYDPTGLIFTKADISDNLAALEVDVLKVGPVRNGNTVHFGVLTCPVADCASMDYDQTRIQSGVNMVNVPLVNFYFQVRSAGSYSLSLNSAQLVKSDGANLLVGDQQSLIQPEDVPLDALDLTHNGFINDSDVWSAAGIWADLTEQGRCTTPALAYYDIDQSGCIDIADMQLILSHWGEPTARFSPQEAQPSAVNATFTVNSDGDASDVTPGDGVCMTAGGDCTLRAAIEESNALSGRDTINFDVRDTGGQCPDLVVIQPATTLIVDDKVGDGVVIDGYTQCGASANTEPITGNAVIKVEIKGNQTEGVYGLQVSSQNNVVRGLAVYDWNYQILLRGQRAQNNSVEGCFIGTNAANTHTTSFPGENDGLRVDWGGSNNTIGGGGTDWGKRNLISGNDQDGLAMQGPEVMGNVATGNYIGLKQDGVTALRNNADGVDIAGGAHENRLGGLNPGDRNVIGGNSRDGVEISHDSVNNNEIVGNFIGLNATGSQITRNHHKGVTLEDITPENRVYRNVIAGNGGYGVRFFTASDSEVFDNFIGVYPSGLGPTDVIPVPDTDHLADLVPAPNGTAPEEDEGLSGVYMIGGSQNNLILRNIIAYHPNDGIHLSAEKGYLDIGTCETYYNTFSQNMIFDNGRNGIRFSATDCNGTTYYPNQNIAAPTILSATTAQVTGTACANCTVEIFIADKTQILDPGGDNNGEGKIFLAAGTANSSGAFSISVTGVGADDLITATATDASGNTSGFARNIEVGGEPMPTDTPTPTGTLTPTGSPTPTGTVTATPTPTPTQKPPVVAGPYIVNLPIVVRQAP